MTMEQELNQMSKKQYRIPYDFSMGRVNVSGKLKPHVSLIVLVGIPGSGKSYWANCEDAQYYITLSSDDIREELCGDITNQAISKQAFDVLEKRAANYLSIGVSVIIDATNTTTKARYRWLNMVKTVNTEFFVDTRVVCFLTPFDVCVERNNNRTRVVPLDVLKRMDKQLHNGLISLQMNEPWNDILYVMN